MKNFWSELSKPFYCLAPMEGITDTVFRRVMIEAGRPEVFFTEFTSVDGLWSKGYGYVADRLIYDSVEKPILAQIWGTKPENFFKTAKLVREMGFDGIDINMGCPDRMVVKKGGGAAMIDNPQLAREIIQATREGADGELPISVKTRIGRREVVIDRWLPWLAESGIQALTIHGRTEKELSKVPARWEIIALGAALVKKINPEIVVIGNGDVLSREEGIVKAKQCGVDGVMIGRGALKNPWVFNANQDLRLKKQEKMKLLKYHLELFDAVWKDNKPLVILRKYLKVYAQGFPGAVRLREALMKAETKAEILSLIEV